jgi:transposase
MARYTLEVWAGKRLFVGIDLHRSTWHVTVLTEDKVKLFSNSIPGRWVALKRVLDHYKEAGDITAVYEAGFAGYWLCDHLVAYGVEAVVTPPNRIPKPSSDRVKTNRIDSGRLAEFLRARILKRVYVPTPEERAHREVARRRRRFLQDRGRTQNRIKALLLCWGIQVRDETRGYWTDRYVQNLRALKFQDPFMQKSFEHLLEEYEVIDRLVKQQTSLLRDLSRHEKYAEQVEILCTIPGVGWLTAIEIILELQDVSRFHRATGIAAYVGLTPSQYSSGEHVRLGRITKQGKWNVRALLVEASWRLIRQDYELGQKYERIKARAGGKRAIVAIARTLIIRMRRILLDRTSYAVSLAA